MMLTAQRLNFLINYDYSKCIQDNIMQTGYSYSFAYKFLIDMQEDKFIIMTKKGRSVFIELTPKARKIIEHWKQIEVLSQ